MNIQNSKAKHKSSLNVKMLAVSAMFAALVTVTTAFIKIPTPLGYSHAGDSMIYLGASVLPAPFGIIAASIGGALADLLSGYANWALPTAVIKAFNALPFALCSILLKRKGKGTKIINTPNILMIIPTTMVTVGGYFLANSLMYGWAAAIGELALCWLQPTVGAVFYIALGLVLDSIKFKQKIFPETLR